MSEIPKFGPTERIFDFLNELKNKHLSQRLYSAEGVRDSELHESVLRWNETSAVIWRVRQSYRPQSCEYDLDVQLATHLDLDGRGMILSLGSLVRCSPFHQQGDRYHLESIFENIHNRGVMQGMRKYNDFSSILDCHEYPVILREIGPYPQLEERSSPIIEAEKKLTKMFRQRDVLQELFGAKKTTAIETLLGEGPYDEGTVRLIFGNLQQKLH